MIARIWKGAVREGDGEQWEVGDSGNPYFTVLWRDPDLCDLLEDALG